jgi:DEAD/DEAH box helicase domain-containing protein
LKQLEGLNIVVYDTEIKNEIDGEKITWAQHNKMGLSVAALHDYRDGDTKVYFEEDAAELADRLNTADLVVGFNTPPFDNKLVKAYAPNLKENEIKNYCLLHQSRLATGWTEKQRFPSNMTLDHHLIATFGPQFAKTDHGSQAPKMYPAGQIGKLVSYCIADMRREKMLFEHVVQHGWVKTEAHGLKYLDLTPIINLLRSNKSPIQTAPEIADQMRQ